MTSTARNSPNNIAPTQDFADISPKPRIASGTLPPQAARAPEFIPGDRKTSDVSSDRDEAAEKNLKKRSRRHRKRSRVDDEADEDALKQQAIDEEWWSGDDVFVPDLKDNENLLSDEQD